MELDTIKKTVYYIMENDELARKDDHYLMWKYIEKKCTRAKGTSIEYFFTRYKNYNLPPLASITRLARQFRREHRELIDQDTKVARNENMEEYKAYFREVNNGTVARDRIKN